MRISILLVLFTLSYLNAHTQVMAKENSPEAVAFEKEYQKNIKLSKINDVYIPKDIDEALSRLVKLSPPASMEKFRLGEEKLVSEKLQYKLGKWMIANWNFYGGSRLSHTIKADGVMHPEDMSQYLMRLLHRQLNNKPLDKENLAQELAMTRKKTTSETLGFQTKANH